MKDSPAIKLKLRKSMKSESGSKFKSSFLKSPQNKINKSSFLFPKQKKSGLNSFLSNRDIDDNVDQVRKESSDFSEIPSPDVKPKSRMENFNLKSLSSEEKSEEVSPRNLSELVNDMKTVRKKRLKSAKKPVAKNMFKKSLL